jgi:hypothetical protein
LERKLLGPALRGVRDRRELLESLAPEQRPPRRAREAERERRRRQASLPPMLERCAEELNVVACLALEFRSERCVEAPRRRRGNAAEGSPADQVVREPHAARFRDRESAVTEGRDGASDSLRRPRERPLDIHGRGRPPGDREQREHLGGVRVRPAHPLADDALHVDTAERRSDQGLEPERRARRLQPQCLRRLGREPRRQPRRQPDAVLSSEWPQLDRPETALRQQLVERGCEGSRQHRQSRRDEHEQAALLSLGAADEVVEECQR